MPFLFKILAIIVGIFIWKSVVGSFRKASKAMDDDSHDDENDSSVPAAQIDLEKKWRETAKGIPLSTFDPGDAPNAKKASITGSYSGHAFTIKRFGHNYVRYFVAFKKNPGFHVCVVRDLESIAARIMEGHPIYPSKMFFSSQEPDFYCSAESDDAFDQFLNTPSNRSAVLNLVRLYPASMFNDEGVSVRLRASVPDREVLVRMFMIVTALENPSQKPMPDLLVAQKKGLFYALPKDFPPAVDAPEEDTPKRFPPIQVDVTTASGTAGSPRKSIPPDTARNANGIRISSEAKRMRKTDTPKADVVRSSNSSAPAVSASPQPGEAGQFRGEGSVSDAGDALTVESVCAALFGKSFPGTEERAAFEAMKGRRVRWSGELQLSLPFSMDFVFGSQKGVKATILIGKFMQGSVPAQIKAVAAFPPELREHLESAKGKTVVFEGDLLKFEPFAREIYLQDASLES